MRRLIRFTEHYINLSEVMGDVEKYGLIVFGISLVAILYWIIPKGKDKITYKTDEIKKTRR